jgi:hypothetical protein
MVSREKAGTDYGVGRAFHHPPFEFLAGPLSGSLPVARCPGRDAAHRFG